MKKHPKGFGLDTLFLLRVKIGIKDTETFLAAFTECLQSEILESFKPVVHSMSKAPPLPDDYFHYRIKGEGKARRPKLINKDAKDFARYQKLKKKFEKEGE